MKSFQPNHTLQLSIMSKLVKFLLKIRFIPVKNGSKITFKLCSAVTFSFMAVYWGVPLFMVGLTNGLAFQVFNLIVEYFKELNIIDVVSKLVWNNLMSFLYMSPLFLGHAFPSVPTLTMARDLKWPRNGAKHVCSIFLFAIGLGASYTGVMIQIVWGKSVSKFHSFSIFLQFAKCKT